jgi:hypothetical protein
MSTATATATATQQNMNRQIAVLIFGRLPRGHVSSCIGPALCNHFHPPKQTHPRPWGELAVHVVPVIHIPRQPPPPYPTKDLYAYCRARFDWEGLGGRSSVARQALLTTWLSYILKSRHPCYWSKSYPAIVRPKELPTSSELQNARSSAIRQALLVLYLYPRCYLFTSLLTAPILAARANAQLVASANLEPFGYVSGNSSDPLRSKIHSSLPTRFMDDPNDSSWMPRESIICIINLSSSSSTSSPPPAHPEASSRRRSLNRGWQPTMGPLHQPRPSTTGPANSITISPPASAHVLSASALGRLGPALTHLARFSLTTTMGIKRPKQQSI